jgi:hypothetical protein
MWGNEGVGLDSISDKDLFPASRIPPDFYFLQKQQPPQENRIWIAMPMSPQLIVSKLTTLDWNSR